MNNSQPLIYGIGNPLIDVLIYADDIDLKELRMDKGVMHLVDEGRQYEIQSYFQDHKSIYHPGGSAPNTMVACAGLGVEALIAGKIGRDDFGRTYVQQVEKYGVFSGLVKGDGPTGSSIILVTPDGERTMNTHLGMCREFSKIDIDEKKLSKSKFFYFTGYMWDTESQKEAIKVAIKIANENNVKIVFDVADPFAVDRNKESFLELISKHVDVLFANQLELSILFGTEDYFKSSGALADMVNVAGIKLGKKGSLVLENGEQILIPSQPISATDSTGAGDMYAAGFLTSLARGSSPQRAGEVGGLLAEEIINKTGAQFDIEEIKTIRHSLF